MQNKKIQYLKLSDKTASRSKDKSTKVGAVIVDKNEIAPLSIGYNGMPRGVNEDSEERNARPEKYLWYEHAERNAIYNLARGILQDKVIYTNSFPNMESARAIVSSGISSVVIESNTEENSDYSRVISLFEESKVKLSIVNRDNYVSDLEDYLIINKIKINSEEDLKKEKKKHSTIRKQLENLDFIKEYGESFALTDNKSACVIMDNTNDIPISFGVYGPPQNINVNNFKGDIKKISQEAEKNAIFYAVAPKLENANIYVSWCPCINCSLAIASVGIKKIVTREPDFTKEADLRWKDSFESSQKFLKELNINIELLDYPNNQLNTSDINSKEPVVKIIERNDLAEYANPKTTIPIIKYFTEALETGIIDNDIYNGILEKSNTINKLHYDSADIYNNYKKMFTVQDKKISIFRSIAEFAGLENNGISLFLENCEMGTSIIIPKEAKYERINDYIKLYDLMFEGLNNPEKYKVMKSFLDLSGRVNAVKNNNNKKNKI